MKIVALIEDGLGHRHLVASRSPDLLRRELSAKTGTAVLLWCAEPPEYQSAAAIAALAMDRLGADGPEGSCRHPRRPHRESSDGPVCHRAAAHGALATDQASGARSRPMVPG